MYHFFVKEEQIECAAGAEPSPDAAAGAQGGRADGHRPPVEPRPDAAADAGPTGRITIVGPDVNHIRNVLRMKPGQQVLIGNGADRDYLCRIAQITPETVTAEILSQAESTELPAQLWLFQGLPKSDKMEWIIQKAVELGVSRIVPVAAHRSVVKLDARKEESRVRRYNAIAESAAKQSGRVLVPEVTNVMTLKEALCCAAGLDVKLIPYENARGMEAMDQAVRSLRPGMSAGILIGPEGGFEPSEVEAAEAAGFVPVSLGRRILRTETAGLTTLSILMYHLELQARRAGAEG